MSYAHILLSAAVALMYLSNMAAFDQCFRSHVLSAVLSHLSNMAFMLRYEVLLVYVHISVLGCTGGPNKLEMSI